MVSELLTWFGASPQKRRLSSLQQAQGKPHSKGRAAAGIWRDHDGVAPRCHIVQADAPQGRRNKAISGIFFFELPQQAPASHSQGAGLFPAPAQRPSRD